MASGFAAARVKKPSCRQRPLTGPSVAFTAARTSAWARGSRTAASACQPASPSPRRPIASV
ncbi:Uncharacterised protein [Mycobacteroides abscessus subsp. abscessus]|nr:Uncharacterised protein [Mycobacteroides abscessus subsp. abscessus]